MSDWRPLSIGANRQTRVKFDSDGRTLIRSGQICDPVLELNHALRTSGRKQRPDWWHVAQIPLEIVTKWLIEDGVNVLDGEHQDYLARKLNDPEWAYLRTGGGRLGMSNGEMR